MKLWTIQPLEVWTILQKQGRFTVEKEKIPKSWFDDETEDVYQWMAQQMRQRIGDPPEGVELPMWAWRQWNGPSQPMPDLRYSGYMTPGTVGVRIEIDIPDTQVLLSDFNAWHAPLNRGFLGGTDDETKRFYDETDDMTHEEMHEDREGYGKKIRESWAHVFDLDWANEKLSVQATFWELTWDMVRKVKTFTARKEHAWLDDIKKEEEEEKEKEKEKREIERRGREGCEREREGFYKGDIYMGEL